MVKTFRSFMDSEEFYGCPVASLEPGTDVGEFFSENTRKEINGNLSELTEEAFSWPMIGYTAISDILSEYGIQLSEHSFLDNNDEETNELVYVLEGTEESETPLFLYILKEQNEDGEVEFHAELVTEGELNDLLDNIPVEEDEDEEE